MQACSTLLFRVGVILLVSLIEAFHAMAFRDANQPAFLACRALKEDLV